MPRFRFPDRQRIRPLAQLTGKNAGQSDPRREGRRLNLSHPQGGLEDHAPSHHSVPEGRLLH
jgi:hypothetical protein